MIDIFMLMRISLASVPAFVRKNPHKVADGLAQLCAVLVLGLITALHAPVVSVVVKSYLPPVSITKLTWQVAIFWIISWLAVKIINSVAWFRQTVAEASSQGEEQPAPETIHAEQILANAPWGAYGVRSDRQVVYANPKMESIAGQQVVGCDHGVVVTQLRTPADLLERLRPGGTPLQLDHGEALYEISVLSVINGVTYLQVRDITGIELANHALLREIECSVYPAVLDIEANYAPIAALLIALRHLLHHALPKTSRGVCTTPTGLGRGWSTAVGTTVLDIGKMITLTDGELRLVDGSGYLRTCTVNSESRAAAFHWLHKQGLSIKDLGPLASYWELMDRIIEHGDTMLKGMAVEAALRQCRSSFPRYHA
jgi:PAS domain-containing protein